MASIFETAGMNELNGSFWSKTSDYSVSHLNSCWGLVNTWLAGLNWLTFKEDTSTYFDASSLTALSKANEEAKYRDYLVPDFDAPLPLVIRFRVSYKGNRGAGYKNTVVIECCLQYGSTWSPWSYITYNDSNDNQYTNNRQIGSPYSFYLSSDRKALCFTQGFFLSSSSSAQGFFPMASHGIFIEYDDVSNTLFGDVLYAGISISKYYLSTYQTSSDMSKAAEHKSFTVKGNVLSPLKANFLPFRDSITAIQHTNSHGYTYKNFIAITEPGATPGGYNVMVDGVSNNYAPTNFGLTMGNASEKGRTDSRFVLTSGYWYYPITACCVYALID